MHKSLKLLQSLIDPAQFGQHDSEQFTLYVFIPQAVSKTGVLSQLNPLYYIT